MPGHTKKEKAKAKTASAGAFRKKTRDVRKKKGAKRKA